MTTHLITGKIVLCSPLHIGDGLEARKDDIDGVGSIERDHANAPYIPGSSLKGALLALANRLGLDSETGEAIFGSADNAKRTTTAGSVEFRNAYLDVKTVQEDFTPDEYGRPGYSKQSLSACETHSVRNRVTGSVQEHLFFQEEVVPEGFAFQFECVAHGTVNKQQIEKMLGLLNACANPANGFSLGSGGKSGRGLVKFDALEVKERISPAALFEALSGNPTEVPVMWKTVLITPLGNFNSAASNPLVVLQGLKLSFTSPFISYQAVEKDNTPPHGKPRRNQQRKFVLPGSSFLGALRSHAERILRTLGLPAPFPYDLKPVSGLTEAKTLDLASILFGAPGWKGVLACIEFEALGTPKRLDHEMLAIDRLTGAGKDSAKYTIVVLECPTLLGNISLDFSRLQKLDTENKCLSGPVLGLLTHVLHDLDSGEIALGYGEAKGYGISNSKTLDVLKAALGVEPIDAGLAALNALAPARAGEVLGIDGVIPIPLAGPLPPDAAGDFHNPYDFIPFGSPNASAQAKDWVTGNALEQPSNPNSHEAFRPDRLHGRISVTLTAKTPIFVGGKRQAGTATATAKVEHYQLNGKLAIPATSLRGLISTLHESITSSPMRVMEDRSYTVRQTTKASNSNAGSSSALGRLTKSSNGDWKLEPLCLPTLEGDGRRNELNTTRIPLAMARAFAREDAKANEILPIDMKVLLDDRFFTAGDSRTSREAFFADDTGAGTWYLHMHDPVVQSWGGMKIQQGKGHIEITNATLRKASRSAGSVLGLEPKQPIGPNTLLSEREFKEIELKDPELANEYCPGLIRSMKYEEPSNACANDQKRRDLAQSAKYPVFIPTPALSFTIAEKSLPVTPLAIERFYSLASEVTNGDEKEVQPGKEFRFVRPYLPTSRKRNAREVTLQEGDLVFFKVSNDGTKVTEISFSSIWRARVEHSTGDPYKSSDFLRSQARRAPLGNGIESKTALLSPTEIMFGVVQDMGTDNKALSNEERRKNPAFAFAGKVRISNAEILPGQEAVQENAFVPLKILASPKPPSPAMYFTPNDGVGAYVSKENLVRSPGNYSLRGRKQYLHAHKNQIASQSWKTAHPEDDKTKTQKVQIQPVSANTSFGFTLDFKNLSLSEFDSLCAAINPFENYQHKIGMGKPLGLGSISLRVDSLVFSDKQARYRVLNLDQLLESAPKENSVDSIAVAAQRATSQLLKDAPAVHRALLLLGDPAFITKPVHYPLQANQAPEEEGFKWFMNNDAPAGNYEGRQQFISPITAESRGLTVFSRAARTKNQ
jgi:CRISPR/Cas system CSM-associated protein Csm3 (group 7 of RAMP superfamily)